MLTILLPYTSAAQEKTTSIDSTVDLSQLSVSEFFAYSKTVSQEGNESLMFNAVGIEIKSRIAYGMPIEQLLDEIVNSEDNSNYQYLLLWALYFCNRHYTSSDLQGSIPIINDFTDRSSNDNLGRKIAAIAAGADIYSRLHSSGMINDEAKREFCNKLINIVLDEQERPEVVATAIKSATILDCEDLTQALMRIVSDNSREYSNIVIRAACDGLSDLGAIESIHTISDILDSSTDEYVFATAAIALGKLGDPASLPALLRNQDRFSGDYCGCAGYGEWNRLNGS